MATNNENALHLAPRPAASRAGAAQHAAAGWTDAAPHPAASRAGAVFALIIALIAALLAVATPASMPTLAWANTDGSDTLLRVNDFCDPAALPDDDARSLSKSVKAEIPQLKFDFVIYIGSGMKDADAYAKGFFQKNGFGYGKDENGICIASDETGQKVGLYLSGDGSSIFSSEHKTKLTRAFSTAFKSDPYGAAYNFVRSAILKVAKQRGVDVSARWPKRSDSATGSAGSGAGAGTTGSAGSGAGSGAAGSAGGAGAGATSSSAAGKTTADLDWYPKDPSKFVEFHNADAPRVVDNADLLTDDEETALLEHINNMRERLNMDFVLVTEPYSYGLSREQYAADFYTFNGYGVGSEYTGVIYYVCMEPDNRGFLTFACGDAQALMTEDNVNAMDDRTYDYFKSGEYGKAISTQFSNLDALYTNGALPFDWTPVCGGTFIAVIAGLFTGRKRLKADRKKMKSVAVAENASRYAVGPHFTVKTDDVIDVVTTRTKHPEPTKSSGGGGGGHSSYSGGFHASGGSSSHHSFSGGGRSF